MLPALGRSRRACTRRKIGRLDATISARFVGQTRKAGAAGVDLTGNPRILAFVASVVQVILLISTAADLQDTHDLLRLGTALIWAVTSTGPARRKPGAHRRT
ncbi:hypothetical protein ACFXPX_04835 [Kitasatospora sp. NPDC059146]|uniref:hypothetical protein n=1 Tax=unclassified Kitasatospora TaxID=2633591 RepID=UPI0036AE5D99